MKAVQRIQSLSNPELRRLKRLQRVESSQKEFLIEGTHLLEEAIATAWPLCSIYYTDSWAQENPELIQRIDGDIDRYMVDARWLRHAVTTDNPDGVVAIGSLKGLSQSRFSDELSGDISDWSLVLVADGIQDPGNAGTLLRTLVGLGGNRLYLSPDSVSPVHPKFLRSTAGQWFRRPPFVSSIRDLAKHAMRLGAQVLVADMGGESIANIDLRKPTVFVLGSEGRGISSETKKVADRVCGIPMSVGVESFNVATTGAILLYEAQRQRNSPKS
jgi:TrmH family RNA methyltransferase